LHFHLLKQLYKLHCKWSNINSPVTALSNYQERRTATTHQAMVLWPKHENKTRDKLASSAVSRVTLGGDWPHRLPARSWTPRRRAAASRTQLLPARSSDTAFRLLCVSDAFPNSYLYFEDQSFRWGCPSL